MRFSLRFRLVGFMRWFFYYHILILSSCVDISLFPAHYSLSIMSSTSFNFFQTSPSLPAIIHLYHIPKKPRTPRAIHRCSFIPFLFQPHGSIMRFLSLHVDIRPHHDEVKIFHNRLLLTPPSGYEAFLGFSLRDPSSLCTNARNPAPSLFRSPNNNLHPQCYDPHTRPPDSGTHNLHLRFPAPWDSCNVDPPRPPAPPWVAISALSVSTSSTNIPASSHSSGDDSIPHLRCGSSPNLAI